MNRERRYDDPADPPDAALRAALAARQLVLHYQPVVDRERRLVGAEALVRWRHPRRGLLGPNDFIGVAEKSDLIVDIGTWVLDAACRQLAAWRRDPATCALTISVNVSARQLGRADFVECVLAALARSGADPALLTLELTESLLLANVDDASAKLCALRAHGVGCALDDFGTGHSSLSYLARLPVAQLKIDRSFTAALCGAPRTAAVVRAIVALARELELDVVAEGVETECQRRALLDCGCRRFQGYLFAAPGPANALARWFDGAPARARVLAGA